METNTDNPDRISQIIDYLNDPTLDTLPDSLATFKYADGFNPDKLEEELEQHPFFMTEIDPTKPYPPLLEAFQQLKYSETDNTPHELACSHKEDGMYHFKLKKYRIASTCFTTAISHELRGDCVDDKFLAQLYNNRSACAWFLGNFRSCVKDCEVALRHDPGYFKAFKRGVSALCELGRWDEVEGMCGRWGGDDKEAFQFIASVRIKARKGKVKGRVEERRRVEVEKGKEVWRRDVFGMVKGRGIRMGDESFLEGEAAMSGRVVSVGDGGELRWPVLFMYPQYSQSDFVEGFSEVDCFTPHLVEMLDKERPSWDADNEYRSDNVDIYYLCGKLVRVDPEMTLLDVMRKESYVLPGNGVPCFFVLANGNRFCEDFMERVAIGD